MIMENKYKKAIEKIIGTATHIMAQHDGRKIAIETPKTNLVIEYRDQDESTLLRTIALNNTVVHSELFTQADYRKCEPTEFDAMYMLAIARQKKISGR